MASTTDLQATVSLTGNNICEGDSTSVKVSIRNTFGRPSGFFISRIDDNEVTVYRAPTDNYTTIPSGQTGVLTQAVSVEEPGEHVFNVRVMYILNGQVMTAELTSPVLYVYGNLETSTGKIVDDLFIYDKHIIQLDSPTSTVWRNGVWFESTPDFIGPDPDNILEPLAEVKGNFYNHNHLIRNLDVDIYWSNTIAHKSLVNPFDFFDEYGALTVTRTLNGFTASGEQQATYTCKTDVETGMIISFDITSISPNIQAVYLEVFTEDNSYYDQVNLSQFGADSNVKIEFTSIRGFTVYWDDEEYDSYESDDAYYRFRFNIGGGNITVDNFKVEKVLSSSALTADNIQFVSGLKVYRSYEGTRFHKSGNNSTSFSFGGGLPSSYSRLDVDVVKITGRLLLYHNNINLNLHELVPDNSHLTITRDGYYTEIFINNQLIRSIKDSGSFPYYLFYVYGDCVFKNMEVYGFVDNDTVTIDDEGDAVITYPNQDEGDVYFLGEFEDLPTIPFHIEDCTYVPVFNENTSVSKQATNNNYYEYDSDNNIGYFKGSVLSNGWSNSGLWECTFDLAYNHGGARYTGLILLANPSNPFQNYNLTWGIGSWEGPITGNPSINGLTTQYVKDGHLTSLAPGQIVSTNSNPTIDWHTIHMRKESSTCLVVWKNDDYSNRVTYQWEDLEYAPRVTIGARTNTGAGTYSQSVASQYGSTCIRNFRVKTYNK
ncbi:MAG: hypothetical protein IJF83_06160 [Methanobrevibacter sp.]|nr:hypothetical protein [Methanobrevibacter sp.]